MSESVNTDVDNFPGSGNSHQPLRSRTKLKYQSMTVRSNIATALVLILFLCIAVMQYFVGKEVRDSRDVLVQKEIPLALNALSMLEELGDMNSNMLEYVLGEPEEKAAYYDNMDEFLYFLSEIPSNEESQANIDRVTRLVKSTQEKAEEKIFSFDNQTPDATKQRVTEIERSYGSPLIALMGDLIQQIKNFDTFDNPDSSEHGSSTKDVLDRHAQKIDKARAQLRIAISALHRHAHNDLEAKYIFFEELLKLETLFEDLDIVLDPFEKKALLNEGKRLMGTSKNTLVILV